MKGLKMVPLEEYQRLVKKCAVYRKAIRDQQRATLVWKGKYLDATKSSRPELKAVAS